MWIVCPSARGNDSQRTSAKFINKCPKPSAAVWLDLAPDCVYDALTQALAEVGSFAEDLLVEVAGRLHSGASHVRML